MKIRIVPWQEVDPHQLRDLYVHFPYPPYFGSPIVDERLQEYRFHCVERAAAANPGSLLVGVADNHILCAAQLRRTAHLSDHFGIEVAGIANEAFVCNNADNNEQAFRMLVKALRTQAIERGVAFMTATAASQTHQWIRALEESGFRYADGFRHVTASIERDYGSFQRPDLFIRDPLESDFEEIAYSYAHMPFPNHLLYEPEFEKGKVIALYVRRYREVHERLGRVFVAEWNGKFAGALNGIIDGEIRRELGISVNHLSQGLIVHPRAAGKGVALALIACRNPWYREQGVQYGYFGSNINNLPMIWGLEKMQARHAGIEISMILRLKDRP
jgi:GNAT superfamily N-acetyltransferase